MRDRLVRSAHTHLALLEGALGNVPEESRAAFNDAFQLSSQGYAQAVETVAFRAPAPSLASLGFLQLRASDPPAPPLDNVFVEVDKIEAYLVAGSESKWITIVDTPNAFDLLRVEQIHKFLGQQEIPAGTYTKIRFEISRAVVVAEGEAHIAKVPSGKLTFGRPFIVREGQTTVVTIDFDGQRSVHLNGQGDYILTPEVKLLVNEPLSDGNESSSRHDHASGKKMEIEGIIESISDTVLLLEGGLTIAITSETEVEGTLSEGLYIEVEVIVEANGSFTAVEVEVKEKKGSGLPKLEIEGIIETMNGDTWTVAGYTVHLTGEAIWTVGGDSVTITTHAEIEGNPQVGDTVEVEGWLIGLNTLLALEIEVEDDGDEDGHREEHGHFELKGVVESLSGAPDDIDVLFAGDIQGSDLDGDVTVRINGASYTINQDTEIEGTLRNGVEVEMKIETAADGTQYVKKIEVEDDEDDKDDDSATTGGGETSLRAGLSGAGLETGKGKADWSERGGRRRLSIEVEIVGGTPSVTLVVKACTKIVGEITLDGSGNGELDLNLDSQDGEAVPKCNAGDLVSIGTALSGTFDPK